MNKNINNDFYEKVYKQISKNNIKNNNKNNNIKIPKKMNFIPFSHSHSISKNKFKNNNINNNNNNKNIIIQYNGNDINGLDYNDIKKIYDFNPQYKTVGNYCSNSNSNFYSNNNKNKFYSSQSNFNKYINNNKHSSYRNKNYSSKHFHSKSTNIFNNNNKNNSSKNKNKTNRFSKYDINNLYYIMNKEYSKVQFNDSDFLTRMKNYSSKKLLRERTINELVNKNKPKLSENEVLRVFNHLIEDTNIRNEKKLNAVDSDDLLMEQIKQDINYNKKLFNNKNKNNNLSEIDEKINYNCWDEVYKKRFLDKYIKSKNNIKKLKLEQEKLKKEKENEILNEMKKYNRPKSGVKRDINSIVKRLYYNQIDKQKVNKLKNEMNWKSNDNFKVKKNNKYNFDEDYYNFNDNNNNNKNNNEDIQNNKNSNHTNESEKIFENFFLQNNNKK